MLDGTFGDPVRIALGDERVAPPDTAANSARADVRRRRLADDLVAEARTLAERHRFLHWEIAFPNIWTGLTADAPNGGFDVVIGNPPYVRQEMLGEIKPALKPRPEGSAGLPMLGVRDGFLAFDGMADLYVYFYEQGLRLLRPGGRMGYVVTNKWLRAGYGEALRGLFAEAAWVEFVADFGHAKHFFPDADVFPSVLVVRRPDGTPPPEETEVCVIPREDVPAKGLGDAVERNVYPLRRAGFTRESWTLEPPKVMALLDKIRRNGVPLAEYAGVKPYRGILTGLNEAFLIDTPTRERLIGNDPACTGIIKPYLRGQDVERWVAPDSGLHMILLKSSNDHPWPWAKATGEEEAEARFRRTYPSLHAHMKGFEPALRARQDCGRFWWELRSCAYYDLFEREKIVWQAIQFYPNYARDGGANFINNKCYVLPCVSPWLLSVLNAPVGWWFSWRHLLHMKDEALSNDAVKMVAFPIPNAKKSALQVSEAIAGGCATARRTIKGATALITDWLRVEFGLGKPGRALEAPHTLDAEDFVAAVRAALPKRRGLSAAEVARLKAEHAATLDPARLAAAELLRLERRLSDMVNAAYGLTPDDVQLLWETAPPRMPLDPRDELRRLRMREGALAQGITGR